MGSMLAREHVTFLHVTLWMRDLLVRDKQVFHVANSVELLVGTARTLVLLPAIQLLSALKLHVKLWSPYLVHVGG